MEGAGSIWNANSWHWEEKNFTEWARENIKKRFTGIHYECKNPGGTLIVVNELKKLEGSASIQIRKQKQLFLFEFEAELEFEAMHDQKETVKGSFKIVEFNQEDEELDLIITCDDSTEHAA